MDNEIVLARRTAIATAINLIDREITRLEKLLPELLTSIGAIDCRGSIARLKIQRQTMVSMHGELPEM